jgi:hypothetical protein
LGAAAVTPKDARGISKETKQIKNKSEIMIQVQTHFRLRSRIVSSPESSIGPVILKSSRVYFAKFAKKTKKKVLGRQPDALMPEHARLVGSE